MQRHHSSMKFVIFYIITFLVPIVTLFIAISWYGLILADRYRINVRYFGDNEIVFDPELGFRRPPNAATRRVAPGIDYNIYTDRRAARVNRPGAQTPDRVTILTVGDSFSEGYGFENQQTYTERLGAMLDVPVATLLWEATAPFKHWSACDRTYLYLRA
jgi:hypothetical protein